MLVQRITPKCCGAYFGLQSQELGNLRGQSEQNFEIYTVDWSQVSVWGLAAGGEALRSNLARDMVPNLVPHLVPGLVPDPKPDPGLGTRTPELGTRIPNLGYPLGRLPP